jgi:hypothetical protein
LRVRDDDGTEGDLPVIAIDQIMRRYGRPLDADIALTGDSLACGNYRLRRLRYHAVVDAEARDYLVWERQGDEPLACIAATAAAALRFLVSRRANLAGRATSGI